MFGALKANHRTSRAKNREFHVAIIGACSDFGVLIVEYFSRIVQRSLVWCAADESVEQLSLIESELRLPAGHAICTRTVSTPSELLELVQHSCVVIGADTEIQRSVELAAICAAEGTHFVGKLEHEASLKKLKSLHYLAKRNSCSISPLCSRDITMAELGIYTLATKFSPGTLLEASIFEPLPSSYSGLLWSSALLASERLSSTTTSTATVKQSSAAKRTPKLYLTPIDTILQESSSTPSITLTPAETDSSDSSNDRLKYSASLECINALPKQNWSAHQTIQGLGAGLRSKARSYGDLDQADDSSTHEGVDLPQFAFQKSPVLVAGERRKQRHTSTPAMTKEPLLPSVRQIMQSRKIVSQISSPPKTSRNNVVQKSLETTPTQLCPARRSLTPLVLSSTSLLPERNQGLHRLEVFYLTNAGIGYRLFLLLLKLFLFLFLLAPFLRRWFKPTPFTGYEQDLSITSTDRLAKLKYYAHHSPTTMTPAVLRFFDPHSRSSEPLTSSYRSNNLATIVIGGLGSTSEYLASSSNQETEKLEFVEVRAPPQLGAVHANVICTSLCAIALSHSPESARSTGVVPPLSAGGKVLKELLISEGFSARSVSFGRK